MYHNWLFENERHTKSTYTLRILNEVIWHVSLVLGMLYRKYGKICRIHTAQTHKSIYCSQQSVGGSVGTDSVKSMWERDFKKYTKIKEKIADIEPIAIVIFSWAAEGLKNILMCISAHVDSVHELYSPDNQS